ncbi:ribonuclease H-like domain-containing protein [Paenibacillus rigui]|uniref:YprB ribonuclease H-like domain-containing protein n=1 Tax=Paenibacillus rigui TaxID=554312 RepID=A0A229UX22_9BACL|nr:ribonuclease H-like domain-containing protein [Paenibacillus rigui]OXM87903.1 hypothetical protein CF651_01995 [Paenibacillus rigui]
MSGLRERLLRHKKPTAGSLPAIDAGGETSGAWYAAGNGAETDVIANKGELPPQSDSSLPAARLESSAETAQQSEWTEIGAHMEHNEQGSFVLRRRIFDGSFQHGRYSLDEIMEQSDKLMSILLPGDVEAEAEGLPYEKLLFLDTETTGLGVGAGNVPFMIGIGFYKGRQFIVEQMFIRHPGEEFAMLHYLEGKLKQHPYLVSYNGKTFDWPLIKNRYILNRMPAEPDIAGHLDFLYPSRSLWKHTLPSCKLGKVEEERLHVNRHEDVPGSLAPTLYFQYLAERDVRILSGVFEHNELDILSLAGLAVHFSHVLNGRFRLSEMQLEEQYRLGLWLSKVGSAIYAEQVLEQLIANLYASPSEREAAMDYVLPAAQWYKQQHRYTEACGLWLLYVEQRGERSTASLEPYLELAMHYEHREKRPELALFYADQAMNKAWQRQSLLRPQRKLGRTKRGQGLSEEERKQAELLKAIEKRLVRLRNKVERAQSRDSGSIESTPARQRKPRKPAADGDMQYRMDSLF